MLESVISPQNIFLLLTKIDLSVTNIAKGSQLLHTTQLSFSY